MANKRPERAQLDGQVAVVTGGGRGIGRATAIRLAEAATSVMVSARTESEIVETAKAGLDHFVRNLAAELDGRGLSIRAHMFYPGVVDTSMQRRIRHHSTEQFSDSDRFQRYHEQGVLRPPEEPAALIWWLATPMAAEFHGRAVSIDDAKIRRRLADDLGVSHFGGREA